MIDTVNGGAHCNQCRFYHAKATRRDRFFGDVSVADYCEKFNKTVKVEDGENCTAFLKRLFVAH